MNPCSPRRGIKNQDLQTNKPTLSNLNSRIAGWVTPIQCNPDRRDIHYLETLSLCPRALRRSLLYAHDVLRAVSIRNVVLSKLLENIQAGKFSKRPM